MRSFTLSELATFDGANGKPAYVAYNGKVYDVSDSHSWALGAHYQHFAGEDLTEAMSDAPHGDDALECFPVIGELVP